MIFFSKFLVVYMNFGSRNASSQKVNLTATNDVVVSVCNEYNHVRSWSVTRFRGMISTQPGSMPLASFKVVSLEHMQPLGHYQVGNDIGNIVIFTTLVYLWDTQKPE